MLLFYFFYNTDKAYKWKNINNIVPVLGMCAQEEEKSEDVMLLHCATRTSFKCQAKLKFADYITVYIYTYILKPIKERKIENIWKYQSWQQRMHWLAKISRRPQLYSEIVSVRIIWRNLLFNMCKLKIVRYIIHVVDMVTVVTI